MKLLAGAIALMVCCASVNAQEKKEKSKEDKVKARQEMTMKQAKRIAHELALEDAVESKFITTFCASKDEIMALGRDKVKNDGLLTEKEAEQEIKGRFERSQKILDIRQKYYKEYSKFLSQKQILRVYELEKKQVDKLKDQGKKEPMNHNRMNHNRRRDISR